MCRTVDQVRAGHQRPDRQDARPYRAANAARPRRRGNRMMKAEQGLPRRRGPRTPEGLERSRRANWKHGYYSREAKAERSRAALAASVASWIGLTSFSGLLTLWK